MKIELKDVDSDELSYFIQALANQANLDLEQFESQVERALRECGVNKRVFFDGHSLWVEKQ